MRPFPFPPVLICVIALCVLSGCNSKTPATRFYVLNPLETAQDLAGQGKGEKNLFIEIGSLSLPQYLERPQIVTRDTENRLDLAEFHQWGGNLRKNMIRVLSKNLSLLLATPYIAVPPQRPPFPPDFRVEVEVMRFERDAGGRVRLSAQWAVYGGKDRKSLVTRFTELSSPPVTELLDPEPTVQAMSTLVGELSRIIAEAIIESARETSREK